MSIVICGEKHFTAGFLFEKFEKMRDDFTAECTVMGGTR